MAIIKWSNDYSVGIDEIDDQHKTLLNLLNSLHDALLVGKGRNVLGDILHGLVKYTEYHFTTEEKNFEKYNFQNLEEHQKEHAELVRKVAAFQNKFDAGESIITIDILNFLKDWLHNHILGSDLEFGKFMKEMEEK